MVSKVKNNGVRATIFRRFYCTKKPYVEVKYNKKPFFLLKMGVTLESYS